MSSGFQPSPFGPTNPYASPTSPPGFGPGNLREAVKNKVIPPAIFLIVVGVLGVAVTAFNAVSALVYEPQELPPDTPQILKDMQAGTVGATAAVVQSFFVLVNLVVIVGGASMLTFKSRTMAIVSSIVAMVNCGAFCCVLGLPAGIWSLIILMNPEVKRAFETPPTG
jgi:hypothetical protein